jgi:hypothetical protein
MLSKSLLFFPETNIQRTRTSNQTLFLFLFFYSRIKYCKIILKFVSSTFVDSGSVLEIVHICLYSCMCSYRVPVTRPTERQGIRSRPISVSSGNVSVFCLKEKFENDGFKNAGKR